VKLLFDENVSPKLVDRLTREFPGSAHVEDVEAFSVVLTEKLADWDHDRRAPNSR
jgi:predicted nuclease of predicted toxin-antitoxin system